MGKSPNYCERLFRPSRRPEARTADFRHSRNLARPLQYPWHGAGQSGVGSGRQTMTFFNSNVQHIAASIVGAFVTATMFVTAAVGPATQLI